VRNGKGDFWLTIPVMGHLQDTIRDKKLVDEKWKQKHWNSLVSSYAKSPSWKEYAEELQSLYEDEYSTLGHVNDRFLEFFVNRLGIKTRVVLSSALKARGTASELVLNICREMGASTYVSGLGGRDYLNERSFQEGGIRIEYVESTSPVYPQFHGGEFIPHLAMIDMMFNCDRGDLEQYLHPDTLV
jgi:hypothetical protein